VILGAIGNAVWDGVKAAWGGLHGTALSSFHIIHLPQELFRLAFFILIAGIGIAVGRRLSETRSAKELNEVYADVILCWLKDCKTICSFTPEEIGKSLELPTNRVLMALTLLKERGLVKKGIRDWEYSAVRGRNLGSSDPRRGLVFPQPASLLVPV